MRPEILNVAPPRGNSSWKFLTLGSVFSGSVVALLKTGMSIWEVG